MDRWFTARWHLDFLIAEHPNEVKFLARRAEASIHLRDWSRAAADYTKAIEGAPGELKWWLRRRMVRLQARDFDGYRRDCAVLLDRFAPTADLSLANYLA
ncbi:MAG: hypothetical protein ACHRXM_21705 [Isosphaerales bacterium]